MNMNLGEWPGAGWTAFDGLVYATGLLFWIIAAVSGGYFALAGAIHIFRKWAESYFRTDTPFDQDSAPSQ